MNFHIDDSIEISITYFILHANEKKKLIIDCINDSTTFQQHISLIILRGKNETFIWKCSLNLTEKQQQVKVINHKFKK